MVVGLGTGSTAAWFVKALAARTLPGLRCVPTSEKTADLARELRLRRPGAPILFATGYADAEALTDIGDHLIVHKPFTQVELARKLSRTLAGA